MDAVLWLARTASPWRNLPPEFGRWKNAHSRFSLWTAVGVWDRLFATLVEGPDFEYVLVDATIAKVHSDAAGQKGGLRLTRSAAPRAV